MKKLMLELLRKTTDKSKSTLLLQEPELQATLISEFVVSDITYKMSLIQDEYILLAISFV